MKHLRRGTGEDWRESLEQKEKPRGGVQNSAGKEKFIQDNREPQFPLRFFSCCLSDV